MPVIDLPEFDEGSRHSAVAPHERIGHSAAGDAAIAECGRQVKGPAIGLLVTGILNWVTLTASAIVMGWIATSAQGPPRVVMLIVLVSAFVCGILMILAALKMKRLQAYGLAVAASILAIIVSPSNLIGLPIGIWALVVLSQREVRAAFARSRASATGSASAPPPPSTIAVSGTPSRLTPVVIVAIGVSLAVLVVFSAMSRDVFASLGAFFLLAILILVCGIIGRKSRAGKLAVAVSALILLDRSRPASGRPSSPLK